MKRLGRLKVCFVPSSISVVSGLILIHQLQYVCIVTCNDQLLFSMQDIISRHVESSRSLLIDLLHGLLIYDPANRITARQALDHRFFRIPT